MDHYQTQLKDVEIIQTIMVLIIQTIIKSQCIIRSESVTHYHRTFNKWLQYGDGCTNSGREEKWSLEPFKYLFKLFSG